ncbi:hypothetical protein QYF36_006739 [Acer negundo]|nr:hypothetical protein QYF36_006739 [Acer negundo]
MLLKKIEEAIVISRLVFVSLYLPQSDCFPDFGFVSDSSIQAIYLTPKLADQVAHGLTNLWNKD